MHFMCRTCIFGFKHENIAIHPNERCTEALYVEYYYSSHKFLNYHLNTFSIHICIFYIIWHILKITMSCHVKLFVILNVWHGHFLLFKFSITYLCIIHIYHYNLVIKNYKMNKNSFISKVYTIAD